MTACVSPLIACNTVIMYHLRLLFICLHLGSVLNAAMLTIPAVCFFVKQRYKICF